MADFRKLFTVLAVIAVFSVSGYAAAFNCVGNPGANKILRAGGITELIGDVQLTCSGDYATPTVNASFAVAITSGSTTVTNRIGAHDATVGGNLINAAAEVRDSSGLTVVQVVQGYLSDSHSNIVLFPNVILPTGTNTNVRFTNIRVLTTPVTSTVSPITVYANVSTAQPNFAVTNALQSVGVIYPTLVFSVTDCAGGTAPSLAYQQCISQPTGAPGALSFGVKFKEDLSTAVFRNKVGAGGPVPNVAYEDGNNGKPVTDGTTTVMDTADTATRLMVRFTNVPTGVNLYVTSAEIGGGVSSPTAAASLITTNSAISDKPTCGDDTETIIKDNGGAELSLVKAQEDADGNLYAIYNVTKNDERVFEQLVFGVQVQYEANPGAGSPEVSTTSGTISGLFAPTSIITVADADSAVPRFLDNPITATSPFSIGPCVTNLLFPYVTTKDGYNTGIALVNTSKDAGTDAAPLFDTSSQTGTCTMHFFGENAVDPVVTTPDTGIVPGTLYKAVVSDLAPGFEGYIIARCNFQYAHGLAFILTSGGSGSQYLALVIPDRSGTVRLPDPFDTGGAGSGEQLGY